MFVAARERMVIADSMAIVNKIYFIGKGCIKYKYNEIG
jgi:hypothetical protein